LGTLKQTFEMTLVPCGLSLIPPTVNVSVHGASGARSKAVTPSRISIFTVRNGSSGMSNLISIARLAPS
jgi:hypothetical protein